MTLWQTLLIDIGRIGVGVIFLLSTLVDLRARSLLFQLMKQKNVPLPWLFYMGALAWKAVTSILLILNLFTSLAAFALAAYIMLANIVFNNFWAADKQHRDFSLYLFLVYSAVCCGLLVITGLRG